MKPIRVTIAILAAGALLALLPEQMQATGTPAGTVITTQATVRYVSAADGTRRTTSSNAVTLVVAHVASLDLLPSSATQNVASDSILVTYPVTLTNSGNDADAFSLAVQSSHGWVTRCYADANGDGVIQGSEISAGTIAAVPSLAADAQYKIILTVMVPRDASLSGQQDTTMLTATSQFNTSRFQTGRYVTGVNTAFMSPRTLSVDNAAPYQDQDVAFTFALTNSGAVAATNVILTDVLAPQFSYVNASSGATRPSSDIVRWSIPSLGAGASQMVTVTVHIPATVPVGTVINNAIGIVYGVGSNTFSVSSNTQPVTVTQNPAKLYGVALAPTQWSLQKEPGDTVVVAFVAKNTGVNKDVLEVAAVSGDTAVVWNFYLDANKNAQFDNADTKLQNTNSFAGVDADSVVSGDSVRIFATTAEPLPRVQFDQTDITSTFTVSSSGNPGVNKSAVLTTTMLIPVVSVSVGISPAAVYAPGDSVIYTITYQNEGHATIDSFSVVNSVPVETEYVASSVSLNGVVQQDNDVIVAESPGRVTVRARVGALSPSQHGTMTYRARIK